MSSTLFKIPKKISSYMKRLELMYKDSTGDLLYKVISNAVIFVREEVSYDNWNSEVTGHAVVIFLEENIISQIKNFKVQEQLCRTIASDLNSCAQSIPNEFIEAVALEIFDENDPECKLAINPFRQTIIDPDSLGIWKPNHLRLFISHKESVKGPTSEFAKHLESYGVSSFVAHNNIEPMEDWEPTIRKALQTMEVMLVFITDGFFESFWTNQEIGFALGKDIPTISLKLENTPPMGFLSPKQACPGSLSNIKEAAEGIYKVLINKLNLEERLREAIVQNFITSNNWQETRANFDRLKSLQTLTDQDVQTIIEGFTNNKNLHDAYYLGYDNRLVNFLENRTGKNYHIENKTVHLVDKVDVDIPLAEADIPF